MNARPLITFAIGLVLAGIAVFFVSERLENQPRQQNLVETKPTFPVTEIVVAANDLAFGHRIGREHVKTTLWPRDSMPDGSFSKVDDLLGDGNAERVVLKPVSRGEPILKSKVSGFGERASMSTMIPEGKRAFAVRVNAVSGVAGFLLPGDRVDVLLTRKEGSKNSSRVTDVILQNIVVRGIDQIANDQRNKPQVARTVTVEVTPPEAQKLALATQVGTLSLALRNMKSAEQARPRTIDISDLKGKPPEITGDWPSVRVRRGANVNVVRVQGN